MPTRPLSKMFLIYLLGRALMPPTVISANAGKKATRYLASMPLINNMTKNAGIIQLPNINRTFHRLSKNKKDANPIRKNKKRFVESIACLITSMYHKNFGRK